MSDTCDTSEVSLKKEGQNQTDEENSNSGYEQEHRGISGTKEESPILDYALFGKPAKTLIKALILYHEVINSDVPWEGACIDVNAGWCPASWTHCYVGLSEHEQTFSVLLPSTLT